VDAAGTPVAGATVTLSSSNGEPDVVLDDLGGGIYGGLFQPAVSGTVTLSVNAQANDDSGNLFEALDVAVTGDVESAADVQTPVFTDGVVGAASYAAAPTPITPGSLVSIFGANIAGNGGSPTSGPPLPTTLGQASVTFGGIPAALVIAVPAADPTTGGDQLNLQVPWELSGQGSADIVVSALGLSSAPLTVNLGVAPAFFTVNASGSGDGAFTHADGSLISAANPAVAGEVIVLYGTALGDVQTPVADGAAAGAGDLTKGNVRVAIGGLPATVQYAGLNPAYVGLYQINVVVPKVSSGSNNVILFVDGTPATGRATIAIK
jgi:uncharacterized protein (TIGR03437 family)